MNITKKGPSLIDSRRQDAPLILFQLLPALARETLDEPNRYGWAALRILADNAQNGERKVAMFTQLVEARADVNVRGSRGTTPLHKACATSALEQVRALVRLGGDCNAAGDGGTTPWDQTWNNSSVRELMNKLQAARGAGVTGEGRFPG